MASRNSVVLTKSMSLSDQKGYKLAALAAGLERCAVKGIGGVYGDIPGLETIPEARKRDRVKLIYDYISPPSSQWPKSVDQRELAPLTDLVVPTALDSWLTAALAAVGAFYSCFQAVAAPQLIQGKLLVVYGISIEDPGVPMPVSRLLFRRGGALGNIQGQYDLEPMGIAQEIDAFLSEPQVIDATDPFAIQVRCRNATAAACIVHLHNFVFETSGAVVA